MSNTDTPAELEYRASLRMWGASAALPLTMMSWQADAIRTAYQVERDVEYASYEAEQARRKQEEQEELFGLGDVPKNEWPAAIRTEYLDSVYSEGQLKRTLDRLQKQLQSYRADFDAIAFRGTSGAAAAYPLSDRMGIPLICVRKPGEGSHAYSKVEGLFGANTYCIVDDLVSTGETLKEIIRGIRKAHSSARYAAPALTHVFLYASDYNEEQLRARRLTWLPMSVRLHTLHDKVE